MAVLVAEVVGVARHPDVQVTARALAVDDGGLRGAAAADEVDVLVLDLDPLGRAVVPQALHHEHRVAFQRLVDRVVDRSPRRRRYDNAVEEGKVGGRVSETARHRVHLVIKGRKEGGVTTTTK